MTVIVASSYTILASVWPTIILLYRHTNCMTSFCRTLTLVAAVFHLAKGQCSRPNSAMQVTILWIQVVEDQIKHHYTFIQQLSKHAWYPHWPQPTTAIPFLLKLLTCHFICAITFVFVCILGQFSMFKTHPFCMLCSNIPPPETQLPWWR